MSPPTNHDLILSFIFLLIISGFAAYLADKKGRNPFAWFIIGLLISFFALIILYFLPSLKENSTSQTKLQAPQPLTSVPPPLPNADAEENKLWYYLDSNHHQYGPVSVIALRELWDTGRLELNSYVWAEGMEKWQKVDELPNLKVVLKKAPPLSL